MNDIDFKGSFKTTSTHAPLSKICVLVSCLLLSMPMSAREESASLPVVAPTPAIKAPVPEQRQLPGGMTLWHFPTTQIPVVSLTVLQPGAGALNDPRGKAGLAALTANMLDEGAGERDALTLADELDFLGASLSTSADLEGASANLRVLRRNLAPALSLLADVLLRPRFEEREWQRVKTLWINNLAQSLQNPNFVARLVGNRVFFGDGHPYGRPTSGTRSTVESLALPEIVAFYKKHWSSQGAVVISAGAISTNELAALLTSRFKDWKGADATALRPQPPALPSGQRPRLVVVNKPAAAQTTIRIMGPGIARRSEDYIPLSMANVIFGGAFTSRLMKNLRETHGYTYGAGSNFSKLRGPGAFLAVAAVQTRVTGPALAEFAVEYKRMASEPLTAEEIEKARATMKQGVVKSLGTLAGTVQLFVGLATAELPPDELDRALATIEKSTPKTIEAAARRTIRWDTAHITMIGDLKTIEEQIATLDLDLGPITVLDEQGNPVSK